MAQIIRVTSEALQATVRRLLPSQQGFGEDLEAQNVIVPIIDLTPSAEGSETRQDLQTAASFGSMTVVTTINTTDTIVNTTGFWLVKTTFTNSTNSVAVKTASVALNNGSTTKDLYAWRAEANSGSMSDVFSYVVFLPAGHSLEQTTSDTSMQLHTSCRQIATVIGDLVDPGGYAPQ